MIVVDADEQHLDCSSCGGLGEGPCCGGPCTITCSDCQGTGLQHCSMHSRTARIDWTLMPAVAIVDDEPLCSGCFFKFGQDSVESALSAGSRRETRSGCTSLDGGAS